MSSVCERFWCQANSDPLSKAMERHASWVRASEDSPQEPLSGLGCLALQRGGQGETRDALDQRQEIAALGAELQKAVLPVAELLMLIEGV